MAMLKERDGKRLLERRHDETELLDIQNAIAKIKAQENRLLDAYGQDAIDIQQLKERMASHRQEREALDKTRAETEERIARRGTITLDSQSLEQWCEVAQRGLKRFTFQDKREFMEALELEITVFDRYVMLRGIIGELPIPLDDRKDVNAARAAFLFSGNLESRIAQKESMHVIAGAGALQDARLLCRIRAACGRCVGFGSKSGEQNRDQA